jgi:hypothetical protein
MAKQEPMLMESPLTKHVYVVTSSIDHGNGTFTARRKYDVTEQFDMLARVRVERAAREALDEALMAYSELTKEVTR